jgi:hypothetical protein
MSVWGLYQSDPTIFNGLQVPDGVDKENVKDNILLESETLEVLYSDPTFLKAAITVWSTERLSIWQRLYETTQYEYNPIENYDRYEEGSNSNSGTSSGSNTASESGESSGTSSTESTGTSSGQNESISSNTAYDSNTFADSSKGTSSGTNETENSESRETSNSDSRTSSNSGSNEFENSGTFTTHIHGNIGVRSSQELIEQERRIATFCITSYIVEEFIDKFCIGVY